MASTGERVIKQPDHGHFRPAKRGPDEEIARRLVVVQGADEGCASGSDDEAWGAC
jgi:hypothetical protein